MTTSQFAERYAQGFVSGHGGSDDWRRSTDSDGYRFQVWPGKAPWV